MSSDLGGVLVLEALCSGSEMMGLRSEMRKLSEIFVGYLQILCDLAV